ncbi:MAG TPA: sulfatase/phosphatase domain-containing protein, partial [Candidatus Dormibacteraeota bacterium]|nr:sulfatase/phosphatase domain-containing protein [Candidatus Dormibacteraeota bacterium]
TADHGESLGEHGYYFAHGEYLYQETLHVPLVVSLPGRIPPGTRIDELAENVDIAPTIVSLLDIDRLQGVDGRPLLVAARSAGAAGPGEVGAAPGRRTVFAESDYQLIHPENHRFYIPGPAGKWSSAFDGRYKLIHVPRPGGDIVELYDLRDDPAETHPLDGPAALPEVRRRLLGELERFVDYGAGSPSPAGDLDPEQRQRLRSLGYVN